jgi:lysozyme
LARKKKYKGLAWVYGAVICSALAFAVYIVFLIQGSQEVKAVEYKAFGIPIPPNYQIHGIDVSRYQERISWEAVKEMNVEGLRIGFAFIKATEGVNNIDPFFKRNWKNAREAGIVRGAYHFFVPTKDGTTQVKNFLKLVKLEPGDLPPVLDVESSYGLSASKFRKQVKKWLQAMETAYGVKPIIYTYVSFYQRYLSGYFDEYPMWVAHYFQLERPRISRSWAFWQHNDQGRVNGILSKVDFNVFNGDSAAFRALLVP